MTGLPSTSRSAWSASTTSRSCVTATTADPSSRSRASSATSSDHVRASWPNVGSSSTSTRGAVASAVATVSRRFSPPESVNGFASARRCEPQPLEQLVDAARRSRPRRAPAPGARRRARRAPSRRASWCSGSWNTVPMRVSSCASVHRIGCGPAVPAQARAPRASGSADAGASSPARVRPSVDLPAPFGPVIASAAPARTARRCPSATRMPGTRCTASPSAASSVAPAGACAGAGGVRGGMPGTHTPRAASAGPSRPEHRVGRPVGDDPAVGPARSRVDDDRQPHLDAVLDDDERRGGAWRASASTASRTSSTPAGSRFAVGSSSSTRPGSHGEQPREGETLLLPAGERLRGSVERHVETDRVERVERPEARSRRAARRGSRSRTRRRRRRGRGSPAHRDPAARARRGRAPALLRRRRSAASPPARPRRRRRALRPGRAAASTCPIPTRRAAARARPARCGSRGSRTAHARRDGVTPSPARGPRPTAGHRRHGRHRVRRGRGLRARRRSGSSAPVSRGRARAATTARPRSPHRRSTC